jgi:predicted GNAT family N-acyltransferase
MPISIAPRLRPYRPDDAPVSMALFQSNVPGFFAASEAPEFAAFLAEPNAHFFVAEREGRVVGCGGAYVRGRSGRLCWGMVEQGLHRSGVGAALLHRRLALLFEDSEVDQVELSTSQHSAGFFKRFGFSSVQTEPDGFAPGIDEVKMCLPRAAWVPERLGTPP